ncbi:MAG: 1-acyl-sn-glycerol-3-phosphate acyltransferase [Rhodospirillaceae bacterium]|jgi:lyso-ornithine lipid O-acyltransferase|nr:1-acyl-sn-glycerol-3-phosphate acyltransferase [Rhodospirillaceae bacterium]MBT5660054.1 1-acyl-sn-glycerol-3-phosphate acyltransferase [Rhodospirillaceae bacterium]MBT5751410.1 1-acyl-sn-glycerol-3-phosphate acyltransferase [Rhodospirillaceae bacterium]
MSIIGRLAILVAYLGWTLLLLPFQLISMLAVPVLARRIPILYHRGCLALMGVHVDVRGVPATARKGGTGGGSQKKQAEGPVLFVANHCGYLDIPVLGSLISASFISKKEVARWPLIGVLARLARTIFVDRKNIRAVGGQRDILMQRLIKGDNLILFPEGTSSDGNRIMDFKTALFAVTERPFDGPPLRVQPVTIAYTRLDGMPMGRRMRPYCAWYGDMPLLSHAWNLISVGSVTVVVAFHPPQTLDKPTSRKAVAHRCRTLIAHTLSETLSGRLPDFGGAGGSRDEDRPAVA